MKCDSELAVAEVIAVDMNDGLLKVVLVAIRASLAASQCWMVATTLLLQSAVRSTVAACAAAALIATVAHRMLADSA